MSSITKESERELPELKEDAPQRAVEDSEEEENEWGEWNAEDADVEDIERFKCIACDDWFDQPMQVWNHVRASHNFDFLSYLSASSNQESEIMYNRIKLINFLRSKSPQTNIQDPGSEWKAEEFLQPFLPDDALLFIEDELELQNTSHRIQEQHNVSSSNQDITQIDHQSLTKDQLQAHFAKAMHQIHIQKMAITDLEEKIASMRRLNTMLLEEPTSPRSTTSSSSESSVVKEIDAGYFGSYAGFHIHEDMLKDRVRTDSYRDFIEGNPQLFKDKYVLDVGCGTGILSMFAVRAGAKHVIAIDNSSIIERAKEIAVENGLSDRITFIRGKAEQIEGFNGICDKVDIIISEWMGYCLLFESMLPSVLMVRDRFLNPSGSLYPDVASLHLVGISAPTFRASKVDFWNSVYGFKMETIAKRVHLEAHVEHMQGHSPITSSAKFFDIDCNKVKIEELDFESPFTLEASEDQVLDAFLTYFDIGFIKEAVKPITFSTSSMSQETHWRQTVLLLENPVALKKGDKITGSIRLEANKTSFRDLDIRLTYQVESSTAKTQYFSLN